MDSTVLFSGKASVKKLPDVVEAKIGQPSQAKWFFANPSGGPVAQFKTQERRYHQQKISPALTLYRMMHHYSATS